MKFSQLVLNVKKTSVYKKEKCWDQYFFIIFFFNLSYSHRIIKEYYSLEYSIICNIKKCYK